jgi:hypothetical protein
MMMMMVMMMMMMVMIMMMMRVMMMMIMMIYDDDFLQTMAANNKIIVAAIDFGTTFSGYAYSLRHDFERDPLHITVNQGWNSGSIISLKAPTTVLLKPDKTFHSFGYEAEKKYADLAENENHENWYYFRQFKMRLNRTRVSISIVRNV